MLLNTKYATPKYAFFDSGTDRMHMDSVLRAKEKIPGPDHYMYVKSQKRNRSRVQPLRATTSGNFGGYSVETDLGYEKNFKSYGNTVFGRQYRKSWAIDKNKSANPGPGNYRY